MRLRHVEVLHAVMLTGSVSGAALLLHVSQPAVTKALRHAEGQIGLALFERIKGRLHPTPEGLALFAEAEKVFAGLEEMRRLAQNLRAGRDGLLRVATTPALAIDVLPAALAAFRRKHPRVSCDLRTLHTGEIASAILVQDIDLGFALNPPEHPALSYRTLAQAELVAVFPPGSPARPVMPVGELPEDLIGLSGDDPLGALLAASCRAANLDMAPRVTVQTYHLALSLVALGQGAAVVDQYTAASSAGRACRRCRIEPAISFPVRALQPRHRAPTVFARAFMRCMQDAADKLGREPPPRQPA